MIIKLIIEAITGLLKLLFALLPDIPQFPAQLINSLNNVFSIIFDNLNLLTLFVRVETIKILVPLVLIVANFEHIYHFIMWIVKKLPLSID